MIWQGPALAILIHIFVYLFNFTLILMLHKKRVVHSRVYMINMIISELFMNVSQNILVEFPYFFPQNPVFYSLWHVKFIEIFSQLGYQSKFFMAILMAINRLWVVLIPIGSHAFSTERLKVYLLAGWIVLFCRQMIIIIPPDCYFKMNLVQFQVMAVCENVEKHQMRLLINRYISYFVHIFIPWVSVIINLIVFICIKRRKMKMSGRRGEKALIVNSFVVSLILTANYLYNYCYSYLKPVISEQSETVQSAFSFFNLYGCICFNFIVYFVLDSSTRKNVLATLRNEQRNGGITSTVATTF